MNTECQSQHKNSQQDHWTGCNTINVTFQINIHRSVNTVIQDISRFWDFRKLSLQFIISPCSEDKDPCIHCHDDDDNENDEDDDDDDDDDDNDVSSEPKMN